MEIKIAQKIIVTTKFTMVIPLFVNSKLLDC